MSQTTGLDVSDVVSVDIVVGALSAQVRDFGSLLILGDSPSIDTKERLRAYTDIVAVAADFGLSADEYKAALAFFSQQPRPQQLFIGRWAKTATRARLNGAILTPAQQALSNFTVITAGSFSITIDDSPVSVSTLNLSTATNLSEVAAAVTARLGASGTCTWNAALGRFEVTSATTGATSTIAAVGTATPASTALGITAAAGADPVNGIAAETPEAATALFMDLSNSWYGLAFATPLASDNALLPVAALVEAATVARILAFTTQNAQTLSSGVTSDIASQLKALKRDRTFVQYSSTNPHAAVSALARAFAVNFNGSLTTLTLKFKQQPGIVAESLTQTQALALRNKNCNVFVRYNNATTILQEGVMASGTFFDDRHNWDWFKNALQTDIYNLLYTSTTKIPQTDAGVTTIIATIEARCALAVTNGMIAPGRWNADGFGQLKRGDYLGKGFYVYAPPIADQIQSDREARISPTIQCAIKMAGAIHFVDLIVNVNR